MAKWVVAGVDSLSGDPVEIECEADSESRAKQHGEWKGMRPDSITIRPVVVAMPYRPRASDRQLPFYRSPLWAANALRWVAIMMGIIQICYALFRAINDSRAVVLVPDTLFRIVFDLLRDVTYSLVIPVLGLLVAGVCERLIRAADAK
jgi:hypothetical protein